MSRFDNYCLECEKKLSMFGSDLCYDCTFFEPRKELVKVSDHVSKKELREWCEGVIQKEVIEGRKSLRRSSDEDIEEIGHLDGMKEVLYRILNRFCKGEES